MTFRLKSPSSIRGKLRSRRLRPGLRTARTLTDIAGIRLVLKDIRQIYRFADRVCRSGVAVPIERRDYIASPKPGGYRSLHLLLGVSVRYHGKLLRIPVEVQLRTPAMHDWAVHDHDTRYKPVLGSRS